MRLIDALMKHPGKAISRPGSIQFRIVDQYTSLDKIEFRDNKNGPWCKCREFTHVPSVMTLTDGTTWEVVEEGVEVTSDSILAKLRLGHVVQVCGNRDLCAGFIRLHNGGIQYKSATTDWNNGLGYQKALLEGKSLEVVL